MFACKHENMNNLSAAHCAGSGKSVGLPNLACLEAADAFFAATGASIHQVGNRTAHLQSGALPH